MAADIAETIARLKAWFPPEAHKERDLPGNGKWFFVPWQLIRERLDEVCPDWQVSYSIPVFLGEYCSITCTITIHGLSRQGVGNAELVLLSNSGKNMARGTGIERACADAFKNAAEAWGVARYLDEQTDPNTKAAFVRYMQKSGDGRAAAFYHQNNSSPKPAAAPVKPKPFGQPQPVKAEPRSIAQPQPDDDRLITEDQVKRFWTIARRTGYTDAGVRELIAIAPFFFKSTREITRGAYETLCNKAQDSDLAAVYNDRAVREQQPAQ